MYEVILSNTTEKFATLPGALFWLNEYRDSPLDLVAIRCQGENLEIQRKEGFARSIGVKLPGSARVVIDRLLGEVTPYVCTGSGIRLAPHQMRRAHWNAVTALGDIVYGVFRCFSTEQLRERIEVPGQKGEIQQIGIEAYLGREFMRRFGYGHNGPTIGRGQDRTTNSRHDVHVLFALAEGAPVPQEVLDEYRGTRDVDIRLLMELPFLRGALPVGTLRVLIGILRRCGSSLNQENGPAIVAVVQDLLKGAPAADGDVIRIDDCLYELGYLPDIEVPSAKVAPTPEPPPCDCAVAHRTIVALWRQQTQRDALAKQRAEGRISLRELKRALALVEHIPLEAEWGMSITIAAALASPGEHLATLVAWLDRPDDSNSATKRFVEARTGIKLMRVKAAERRRAIFALSGLNEAQQEAWIAQQELEREQKLRLREEERIRERAADASVVADGRETTWKDYIDQLVASGMDRLSTYQQGRSTRRCLTDGKRMLKLAAGSVALAYAELACRAKPRETSAQAEPVSIAG